MNTNTVAIHRRWSTMTHSKWWPWASEVATLVFIGFIITILVEQAQGIDWSDVWTSVWAIPLPVLVGAALLAVLSHALYATFDLFGRHYTKHGLSKAKTVGTTLIAYPFALNLGSFLGGASVRYRLYTRAGVSAINVGKVIAFSIVTNWLGYFMLAGIVFSLYTPAVPSHWAVGSAGLTAMGLLFPCITLAYLWACHARKGGTFGVAGHDVPVPRVRVGLLQTAMSCANWMLMASVLWWLSQGSVPYVAALSTVLVAAVAGLVSRIPAGIGVWEAVGVAMLAPFLPSAQALALVLAFRALYFIAPFIAALVAFGLAEWRAHAQTRPC